MSTIGKIVISAAIIFSAAFAITMSCFRQRTWRRLHTMRWRQLVAREIFTRWLVMAPKTAR